MSPQFFPVSFSRAVTSREGQVTERELEPLRLGAVRGVGEYGHQTPFLSRAVRSSIACRTADRNSGPSRRWCG